MQIFPKPIRFQWDKRNIGKNFIKHQISDQECEEVFFDADKKLLKDRIHSGTEERYLLIGKTKSHKLLFIVFTMRINFIRVISARKLNKREYKLYE